MVEGRTRMGAGQVGFPVPVKKPALGGHKAGKAAAPQAKHPPQGPGVPRDTYRPAGRPRGYGAEDLSLPGKIGGPAPLPQAKIGGSAIDSAALQARIGRLARLVAAGESNPADLASLTTAIWKDLSANPGEYAKLPEGERLFALHMALFGTDGGAPTYVARTLEGLKGDQAALTTFQNDLDTVLSARVAAEQDKIADKKVQAGVLNGLVFMGIGCVVGGPPGMILAAAGVVNGLGIDEQLGSLDMTAHDKAFVRTLHDRANQLRGR